MDLYLNCLCNDLYLTNSFYAIDLTELSVCACECLCLCMCEYINAFSTHGRMQENCTRKQQKLA